MQQPFIVFSLPRSRSAWLAHWLHDAKHHPVGHDISIECDRPAQFVESYANGMRGTIETGAVEYYKKILDAVPELKVVLVRRPLEEVHNSLMAWGIDRKQELIHRNEILDVMQRELCCEHIDFRDLTQLPCRQWLWAHLLPEVEFDAARDEGLEGLNIQVDMLARVSQLYRRRHASEGLRNALN